MNKKELQKLKEDSKKVYSYVIYKNDFNNEDMFYGILPETFLNVEDAKIYTYSYIIKWLNSDWQLTEFEQVEEKYWILNVEIKLPDIENKRWFRFVYKQYQFTIVRTELK